MRLKGFIGPTYALASQNIEAQRTVNCYPEIDELHTAADGEIGSLVSTPGSRLLATLGTGPIRGMYVTSDAKTFIVVSGKQVFSVKKDWTSTLVGVIGSTTGSVGIADNGKQICIVDGKGGYIITLETMATKAPNAVITITSDGFSGATNVVFQDGYFIFNKPDSGQFYISALYDGLTEDALDFASAEGSPDNLVTLLTCRRQVWLLGGKTIEVWWDSGAADFPFSRYDGAFIEYGCVAPWSAVVFANQVLWLGGGPDGDGIVWMAQGFQPTRISNHAVEYAIQKCGDVSLATSYVYQHNGHMFYCLNLPNSATTWVYDLSTQQWHERAYLGTDGQFQRHRGDCYAWAFNTDVIGDYQNGNIYALDDTYHTDNGNPIKGVRRSPYVSADMLRTFHIKLEVAALMGVGLDGTTAPGTAPSLVLRYSDDFGHTWSNERIRALGQLGQYRNRCYWDRLGSTRTRIYEISWTDPVQVVLQGAEIAITSGGN